MTETVSAETQSVSVGDGKGEARKDLARAVEKLALKAAVPFERQVRSAALNTVTDLMGFYAAWHLFGGSEGLQRLGMQRSMIYRKVHLFQEAFGSHPDLYDFPGLRPNQKDYLAAALGDHPELPYVLVGDEHGLPARLPR